MRCRQWAGIVGTDDKPHGLADYKDAKLVVVVFTCNHCPVATAYQERLVALQKDYKDKGVQVVAVCVNKGHADNLDAMKRWVESAGSTFPTFTTRHSKWAATSPRVRRTSSSWTKTASWLYRAPLTTTCTPTRSKSSTSCGARCLVERQDAGYPLRPCSSAAVFITNEEIARGNRSRPTR